MRPVPINCAEAIFEPFWDDDLNELSSWEIAPGDRHGLEVGGGWSLTPFSWTRRPEAGRPALEMTRDYERERTDAGLAHASGGVACTGYDALMLSIMPPQGAVVSVLAETDAGSASASYPPAGSSKREYLLPLNGASRIRRLTVRVHAGTDGVASGWFNWIGLQNTEMLPRYLEQWKRFDERWERYLKPQDHGPAFVPQTELVLSAQELERLRLRHDEEVARLGTSRILEAAEQARRTEPEALIGEYVNFSTDTRYCRERDFHRLLLQKGIAAAVAGLVTKDATLLRLAARYAMSIAMCGNWDDGFICRFGEGTFEHRSFVQSLCAWETAAILDLAGEWFTPLGKDLVLRRIAEEAIGHINFSTWKHEYIWSCNQLAWFSPGRMLGLATLATEWPRASWYLDRAKDELVESLDLTILPDGGYVEGPTYFRCVGRDGGLSLFTYARAKGIAFPSVIPDSMRRTADFGEALMSTDTAQDMIPICDGRPLHDHESLAFMAAALPQSQWTRMFRKAFDRDGGSKFPVVYQVIDDIPTEAPEPRPFVFLPEMGVMSSYRRHGNEVVKLFLMGNKAGAGHTHEDKGSFVLEYAGETFAMDPGTCDYASPFSLLVKNCERHNMLLPCGTAERPRPASPLPVDVKPAGSGDETSFDATIDLTPGWEAYYARWTRRFESPDPSLLVITDEYELVAGDGVDFLWNTRLPVEQADGQVIIRGAAGLVRLAVPRDSSVDVVTLPLYGDDSHQQIRIRTAGAAGETRVEARLEELP